MVDFRLDRRLYGRVDSSDVLQEAYMEISRRVGEFLSNPTVSFFVWARQITWQTLLMTHRKHLGVQKRNVRQEVRLHHGPNIHATSVSLAAHLIAQMTSPSQAAIREERYNQLHEALNSMDEIDREVLALRHFEHLSNNEVAQVLGIQKTAASNRYVRALKRLKEILESFPDLEP
jgi:RNA polymerase sigma-70 factor (ECF subfamily)